VPPDTVDGSILVITFNDVVGEGAVLSDAAFQVPPRDTTCAGIETSRMKTVRTTATSSTSSNSKRIPDESGRYRAMAPKIELSGAYLHHVCLRAISPVRTRS
jgi:hypothetical protein